MIEAKNIHKSYTNGGKSLHVLKGISLSVDKGDFAAITGPSGAGKSTLLHILGGLDMPSDGKAFFEGKDINKLNDAALCKMRNEKIGFVFQFYHLLSEFTVLENVLMPGLINSSCAASGRQLKKNAVDLLEKTGLSARMTHFPNELSGGEKQRVAIARALINKPAALFCDEPTGNLDSDTGSEIIGLIKKINSENKMTVVLVTHNIELAKIADKAFHLKDGILVQ